MGKPQKPIVMCALVLCGALLLPAAAHAVTLRVLEWEGYISHVADAFEEWAKQEKGVDVTLEFLPPAANPDHFFVALRKNQADIVTPTHNYYAMQYLPKLLLPLDFDRLENYRDVTPSLRTAKYDEYKGRKHSVPLVGGSYGLAFNRAEAQRPVSWDVLWEPESRGRYPITSEQFEANIYLCMLMAGYSPDEFYNIDTTQFDRVKVQQLLNTLVLNAHSFWKGMVDPEIMPELKYTTTYWIGVRRANLQGQDWLLVDPAEGQTVWLDTIALSEVLMDQPEKLDAAYLLVDYMLSPEVQKRLHEELGLVVVNMKTAEIMSQEQVDRSHVGKDDFFHEEWFWRPLPRRTRNMYRKMWNEAVRLRDVWANYQAP